MNVLKEIKRIKRTKRNTFRETIKRLSNMNYVCALLLDPEFGIFDGLIPQMFQSGLYKATNNHYPDSPLLTESLSGNYRAEFIEEMKRR